MARDFATVGVIGLGTMGVGIVEVFARNGLDVVAAEVSPEAVEKGKGVLRHSTDRALSRGKLTEQSQTELHDRVRFTSDLAALAECDLVVEAVPEHLDLKREIFARLDQIVKPDASWPPTPPACPSPRFRWPPRTRAGSWGCTSSTRPR